MYLCEVKVPGGGFHTSTNMCHMMQEGLTPLCAAVVCGNVNVVEALIQHDASMDQQTEVSQGYFQEFCKGRGERLIKMHALDLTNV